MAATISFNFLPSLPMSSHGISASGPGMAPSFWGLLPISDNLLKLKKPPPRTISGLA
ncbi:hypothetical protein COLO4_28296 [Corchorus olitorius]|uniref:Uncharacterized protein n=1 Tax=Corchorus olitorius TaxID=93759 RepID=A0A1R3HLU8_9ROSI|nr:hypothetical protein COLO4_28296 [Corchorus olitorius]